MVSLLNIFGIKGFAMFMVLGVGVASGSFMNLNNFVTTAPQAIKEASKDLDTSKLTVEQIRARAIKISSTWSGKLSNVKSMMAVATKKKNIMRMNCLEPKIKSVGFWVSEGKSAHGEIKGGSGKSKERMALLFQKITVIDSNVNQQVLLASRCIGDEKFSSGEGFELKASHPDEVSFDPDEPTINFDNFIEYQIGDSPDNPDWSVELTWPTASPYI